MPGNPLSITLPTVGDTEGPDYATQINNAITIIVDDLEAQVLPSEITVNEDFSYSSSGTAYGAVDLDRVNFTGRGSLPSATITESVFTYNNELYFQDGAGNNVAITSGGSVAGAPGNITTTGTPVFGTSDTALLWSGGDLQFQFKAGANTWADLVFGDAMFRNGTNTMTMTSGVTTDYTITWPTTAPGSGTKIIQVDSSGALSFTNTVADAATFTGLITANAGLTAGANQNVTISGTGEYKHGKIYKQIPFSNGETSGASVNMLFNKGGSPSYGFCRFGSSATSANYLVFPVEVEEGQTLEDIVFKHFKLSAGAETFTYELVRHTSGSAPISNGTQVATTASASTDGTITTTLNLSSHAVVADSNYYVFVSFTTGGTQEMDLENVKLGFSR